jgi:2-amino-4-hydroxy-6-hydroxymethyldihydropteridine diphosphokinase
MHKAYLSLGSNIGQKVDYLDKAVDYLKNSDFIHKLIQSSYYTTDPVGYLNQDEFVNIALYIETSLDPNALLLLCHDVENALDRERIIRWGPRTIDVDIILYDDLISHEAELTLPHPRAHERGFVLIPLFELNQNLVIKGRPIKELIESLPPDGVRKM